MIYQKKWPFGYEWYYSDQHIAVCSTMPPRAYLVYQYDIDMRTCVASARTKYGALKKAFRIADSAGLVTSCIRLAALIAKEKEELKKK